MAVSPNPVPEPGPGGIAGMAPTFANVMASGEAAARAEGAQRQAGAEAMAQAAEQRSAADRQAIETAKSQTRATPAFVPTKETALDLSSLFGLIGVVGTALGGRGKSAGMTAMRSMTGMMEGYQQGRSDLYQKEYNQFKASMEEVRAHNEQVQRELQYALKLSETDMEKGKAHAELAMARLGSDVLLAKVRHQGLTEAWKTAQQIGAENARFERGLKAEDRRYERARADALADAARVREQQLADAAKRRDEQLADARRRFEESILKEAPFSALVDGRMQTIRAVATPEGGIAYQTMDGQPVSSFQAVGKGGEGPQSQTLARATGFVLPEKDAALLNDKVRTTAAITDLVDRANDPDIAKSFGELGRAKTTFGAWIERNITGKSDNDEVDINSAYRNFSDSVNKMAEERGLSANDKALVWYKDAVFSIMEAERAAAGNRLLVSVFKQITPLLDPKNLSKEAFQDIMSRRAEQIARSTGLSPDQYRALEAAIPRSQLAPTAPRAAPGKQQARPGEIVHVDGNGNRAVQRDGKWVEVE